MAKVKEQKIETTVESFLAALKNSFVEKKVTIPILVHVRVHDGNLYATDLDISTIVPFEGQGKSDFMLPYKKLVEILSGETGPLEIVYTPSFETNATKTTVLTKGVAKVRVAGCEFSFDTMPTANWPVLPEAPKVTMKIDGKFFRSALDKVVPAISTEKSRYRLNGALFQGDGKILRIVATDGHRLSLFEIESAAKIETLVPANAMRWIRTRIGESVEIGTDDNLVLIKTNGITTISRRLKGQFPNWKSVMPTNEPLYKTVSFTEDETEKILSALPRIAKMADERSGAVRFAFSTNKLELSAQSSDHGTAKAVLDCTSTLSQPVHAGFNNTYIRDFLKGLDDGDGFTAHIKDSQSCIMLTQGQWKVAVMPMRI